MRIIEKIISVRIALVLTVLSIFGCTDLEFQNEDAILPEGLGDPAELLAATYGQLAEFANERTIFSLSDHSSDELIGPTRGTDWFDGGVFQQMQMHTWGQDHGFIKTAWETINIGVYRATLVIASEAATPQQIAEAKVLRAFYMFHVVDFWGIAPFREAGTGVEADPVVLSGAEATNLIIEDLETALLDLPETSTFTLVNKNTARALLAKVYLNRSVFASTDRSAAFTFNQDDMNKVVQYVEEMDATGTYSLSSGIEGYFNTFSNGGDQAISTELIFTIAPDQLTQYKRRWIYTLHYNQQPNGWNGFATLSNFYDSFEEEDVRRGGEYNSLSNPFTENTGTNVGFLVDQQFDKDGNALTTRNGTPLVFTREVSATTNTEETGIRVVKFVPDYNEGVDLTESPTNSHVLLRYADAFLNKAEALFRGGVSASGETAQSIMDQLRAARGVAPIEVTLESLLEERGRELYWEGWRRNDLIRFGKFLDPWQEKEASGPERVLFPIPVSALVTNPNLIQNPGY